MRRALACVLAGLTLLSGACSGSDDDPTPKDAPNLSKQIAELDGSPEAGTPDDEPRPDRDPDAVTAALWRLDACGLIAPGPGQPGQVEPSSPHSCRLRAGSADHFVDIGMRVEPPERTQLATTTVAGTTVYLLRNGSGMSGCAAWLPVSSTHTIAFTSYSSECRQVRTMVRRAIERIDKPNGRQNVPGLGDLDTCTLLEHGLGPALEGRKVAYGGQDDLGGVDHCVAISERSFAQALFDTDGYATLELETTPPASVASGAPVDFGTIRGRHVFGERKNVGRACLMRWAESTTVVTLESKSCAQARKIVSRMTRLLDGSPGKRVAPQRPILYPPGDADHTVRGACADYLPLWYGREYVRDAKLPPGPGCHPYSEVDPPDGGAQTVLAAEADPDVTCAVATDAVHEEFPERLQPATLDADVPALWSDQPPFRARPCVFVDPNRRIQVQVFVSSDPMPVNKDAGDRLVDSDSGMRIPLDRYGTGYLIGLGERPDDPGYVAVFVGRRFKTSPLGEYDRMQDSSADAESVADAIVDEHLAP